MRLVRPFAGCRGDAEEEVETEGDVGSSIIITAWRRFEPAEGPMEEASGKFANDIGIDEGVVVPGAKDNNGA